MALGSLLLAHSTSCIRGNLKNEHPFDLFSKSLLLKESQGKLTLFCWLCTFRLTIVWACNYIYNISIDNSVKCIYIVSSH